MKITFDNAISFSFRFFARYSHFLVRVNSPRYLFRRIIAVYCWQTVAHENNAVELKFGSSKHGIQGGRP